MHLQIAAEQLSVGITTLKKICRTASVNRWPFRKRTSIERLIERTEYFMPLVGDDAELQQHMATLQALLERKDDFKVCCNMPSLCQLAYVHGYPSCAVCEPETTLDQVPFSRRDCLVNTAVLPHPL